MENTQYFVINESVSWPGKFIISLNFGEPGLPKISTKGSYNVLMARLLNLEYADYLRFCREQMGATLYGKGQTYPIPLFDYSRAEKMVKILNSRIQYLIERRDTRERGK